MEQRTQLLAAANRADTQLTDRWAFQLPEVARKAVADSTIEVLEPDAALLAASEEFAAADAAARVAADPLAGQFADLVKKWTAIVEEVGGDPEALAARAQTEIWSKIDLNTYGM